MTDTLPGAGPVDLGLDADAKPPRRAGPKPVTTVEELLTLDNAVVLRGYRAGLDNAADWTQQDRAYWHGYLNGMVDGGHATPSPEQVALASAYVRSGTLKRDVDRWLAESADAASNV